MEFLVPHLTRLNSALRDACTTAVETSSHLCLSLSPWETVGTSRTQSNKQHLLVKRKSEGSSIQSASPLRNLEIAQRIQSMTVLQMKPKRKEAVQVITVKSFNGCLIGWEERQHNGYVSSSRRYWGELWIFRNIAACMYSIRKTHCF